MAVLEKIRVQMGIFITVLIAIALISFIIDPGTLQSAISMFSSKNDVGEMNGQSITYIEYNKKREYYQNLQQALTGAASLDEQSQEVVEQGTWQAFLKDLVYVPAIEKAGIRLGDEEMFDMVQGRDISPVILKDALFLAEDGTFDRSRLTMFVQNATSDPDGIAAMYWQFIQDNMETDRLFTKYSSLLSKSNIITPVELRRNMEDNNITSNVSFSLTPVSFAKDTTITVTPQEIRAYYDTHKHLYKQMATRDIEYVVFPIIPSAKDIADARADIEKVYDEFVSAGNLRQFLARNSDKPYDTRYYKEGELTSISAALDSFAFKATMRDVLPVYKDGNFFRAARIADIKQLPDSVFVHHILLQNTAGESKKIADSLITILNLTPGRFAELALEFSADKNPNVDPGVIGWFNQNAYIPGMESVFEAPLNKPFILETQYGLHLVKVTERTRLHKKVQLAVLIKEAIAGKETYQTIYSSANNLSTESGNIEAFNRVAMQKNLYPVPAMGITEDAKTVSGYEHMRELVRWAFDAKHGEISPVISVDNKYFFVAAVTGVHDKGIATLQEKQAEIESVLTLEKKRERIYDQIKEELEGYTTLESWAEATGRTISTQAGLAFGSSQQTDPKFIGAVSVAAEQVMCGPVKGEIGIYVFQVDERLDGAYYTENDAFQYASYLSNIQIQMIPMVLQEGTKVEDYRAKFF
ncbi:MAG: peptidylprolyl isomerase [Bacteroidales bacterium]|jgi:peptidyl-prolyl cis-trans isomerase D|nr:SurA N-terminal domain-containing protein [Bacteroidales bacterium]MDD2263430.1 SurA N-terminal domain-containing protein [Bacteroidales bacterium]MDD2830780.1 SurA N-terminal domain-containing protein [Bacteroidales bacterium]MDD3207979.1 SurA N-terminal domain-containing protein [Bacteroidales bacterium]MDD3696514.1 SurA N-terminal domain-containing protein [Bacteroidales bacterium]